MSCLQMRLEAQRQRLPFSTNLCFLELCLKQKFNKHQLSIAMTKAILRRSFYIRPFLSVFRVHSLMCRKKNPWLKKMDCGNLDRFKQSENGGPMSRQALQIKTQIEIKKKSCGGKYPDWISSDYQTQWLQKSGSVLPGAAGPGESQRGGNPGTGFSNSAGHLKETGAGGEVCWSTRSPKGFSLHGECSPRVNSYYFKKTMSRKTSIL